MYLQVNTKRRLLVDPTPLVDGTGALLCQEHVTQSDSVIRIEEEQRDEQEKYCIWIDKDANRY